MGNDIQPIHPYSSDKTINRFSTSSTGTKLARLIEEDVLPTHIKQKILNIIDRDDNNAISDKTINQVAAMVQNYPNALKILTDYLQLQMQNISIAKKKDTTHHNY